MSSLTIPALIACAMCQSPLSTRQVRQCQARGDAPLCADCIASVQAQRDNEAARHEAYEVLKAARIAKAQEERDAWRYQRYLERCAEHEAYMIRKAEERAQREDPDLLEWQRLLALLGGAACR